MVDNTREMVWKDTLTTEELSEVDRLASMPPSMAIGYVYVEMTRRMKPSVGIVERLLVGASGGGVVVLGLIAHALGLTEKVMPE